MGSFTHFSFKYLLFSSDVEYFGLNIDHGSGRMPYFLFLCFGVL